MAEVYGNLYMGMMLAVLAGCFFLLFCWQICQTVKNGKRPLYLQKRKAVNYPEMFLEKMKNAYQVAGSFQGMLQVLKQDLTLEKKIQRRVLASLDYLEHSRYKDYETMLYEYLWDGSEQCRQVLDQILAAEIQKQMRLSVKK